MAEIEQIGRPDHSFDVGGYDTHTPSSVSNWCILSDQSCGADKQRIKFLSERLNREVARQSDAIIGIHGDRYCLLLLAQRQTALSPTTLRQLMGQLYCAAGLPPTVVADGSSPASHIPVSAPRSS